jgi:alpha,alpha-trehalase
MPQSNAWQLFTRGPLFEAVQALQLFRDSKTFPDMIPKGFDLADEQEVDKVLRAFVAICQESFLESVDEFRAGLARLNEVTGPLTVERLKQVTGLGKGVIDFRSRLSDLIHEHFQGRHEAAVATGLPREPTCSMEAYIDGVWSALRRDLRNLPQDLFKGTLLRLDYPYVVAGGRFDEVYYWDGYFTGEGLVLSGGLDLFDCMVKNYAAFIHQPGRGFIPNGNRQYYSTRSQPPFFYLMVDLLARTKGLEWVKATRIDVGGEKVGYIDAVRKEYRFWMDEAGYKGRAVRLPSGAVLNRYWDHFHDDQLNPSVQPRPEAYHEDIGSYADTKEGTDAATFFRHIRAAAESGWDFSSRWFRPDPVGWDGGIRREVATMRTTDIVPVDLNALLYGLERKLSAWTGDPQYAAAADRRKQAVFSHCWNDELGWFFDHCTADGEQGQTDVWSLAGSFPLFTQMLDPERDKEKVERMVRTIRTRFLRAGGVVTTLFETGQQWDYPNGWAPLQWVVIRGLLSYGHDALAQEIARRFVGCVGRTYRTNGRLMEKYNVCEPEATAGGGEYAVQHGFGWTNGVVKALMVEFRSQMEADETLRKHLG